MTDYREQARAKLKLDALRAMKTNLILPFAIAPGDVDKAWEVMLEKIMGPTLTKIDELWAANDKWSESCNEVGRSWEAEHKRVSELEDQLEGLIEVRRLENQVVAEVGFPYSAIDAIEPEYEELVDQWGNHVANVRRS
jgi:hypothetical protein